MKCFYCLVEGGPFQPKEAFTAFNGTPLCSTHAVKINDARKLERTETLPVKPKLPLSPKKVQ